MIRIVFIGYDKKCLSIIKMSIPSIKISLIPYNDEPIVYIKKSNPDIVLLDLDLQSDNCSQLIKQIQSIYKPPSILITGECDKSQQITKAIRMGVLEYIPKPFTPDNLLKLEDAISKSIRIVLPNNKNCGGNSSPFFEKVIGCSKKIENVKELIISYSKSGAAIFLLGESGVGKNLIAETIHMNSIRSSSPYKTIHTAGLPHTLIESELFGTNAGAFTGAVSRPGCFESANKGTLFLDEIGELPLSSQVKLLRILEEKTITRLGGTRQIPIDVRIISATNKNITKALRNRTFRQDLFYRINTLTITIPPLRERKEDIPLLVDFFLKEKELEYSITTYGLEKLIDHPWPGNIRELKNTLERSKALAGEMKGIHENHIIFY